MLVAIYPQKFLPYRYLHPFLRSTWDSQEALQRIAAVHLLILQAGSDEIVPAGQAETLRSVCAEGKLDVKLILIKGALHTEIMAKREGRNVAAQFLKTLVDGKLI